MTEENSAVSKWYIESDLDKYLFPFLSPTSEGTKFWESQPEGELTRRQIGRICLQVHQLVERIKKSSSTDNLKFLDIGTGNGFIPRLLPYFLPINVSHGCDPFLDGEHQTGFQKHNRDKEFFKIISFLREISDDKDILSFENYSSNTNNEHFYGKPLPLELFFDEKNSYAYSFHQVGAHELEVLETVYDYLYCKAIEHIHDWETFFEKAYQTSSENAVFYLKHKSFFSYLGAHRYGSVGIPWGHLRMNDIEYKDFVDYIFPERSESMKEFFFNGLSYPRQTIGEMIKTASSKGWKLGSIEYERSKHTSSFQKILFENNSYIYKQIKINYDVSIDELLSGLTHIIFTK